MIRTRPNKQSSMITGINITPFTDVCLVLLIIFMVTASALSREASMRLDLPRAASADTPLPTSTTAKITREGHLYLDEDRITFDTLGQRLQDVHARSGAEMLVVRADEGVPYKLVIATIDIARQHGFDQIALATREPEKVAASDPEAKSRSKRKP